MKLGTYGLMTVVSAAFLGCAPQPAESAQLKKSAQADVTKVSETETEYTLERTDLGNGLYMLVGSGGNIGLSTGPDGAFVIDDQYAKFAAPVLAEINSLSDGPIRFVVNTHYHGDHTGGNEAMTDAGALIIAHDNVRARMAVVTENLLWGRKSEPTSPKFWPAITFSQTMTFHFNGQTIDVIHTPEAHTDGDAIIYFREADVLHMGDNFFNGIFPYIDVDANGSVAGMIKAHDAGLMLAGENTKIIPGHGPLSTKANLQATRDTLSTIQSRVKSRIDQGENLEIILEANVLSDLEHLSSFIDSKNMVKVTYRSLTGSLK